MLRVIYGQGFRVVETARGGKAPTVLSQRKEGRHSPGRKTVAVRAKQLRSQAGSLYKQQGRHRSAPTGPNAPIDRSRRPNAKVGLPSDGTMGIQN